MLISIACGNLQPAFLQHVKTRLGLHHHTRASPVAGRWPEVKKDHGSARQGKLKAPVHVTASAGCKGKNQAACLSYISTVSFDLQRFGRGTGTGLDVIDNSAQRGGVRERLLERGISLASECEEDVNWQSGHQLQLEATPDSGIACQLIHVPGSLVYLVTIPGHGITILQASCLQTPDANPRAQNSKVLSAVEQLTRSRRMKSLVLLNILAALYGTGTVVSKFVDGSGGLDFGAAAPPASLSSLVRYTAAVTVFFPALRTASKKRDHQLVKAGTELGGYLFAATVFDSLSHNSNAAWNNASWLFAVSVIFVPLMEICAGRDVSKITWLATLAALSGMGLLEEEGSGWQGFSVPQTGDLWSVAGTLANALHIVRAETAGGRFDAFLLTAVQLGVVAALSAVWECVVVWQSGTSWAQLAQQVGGLPWVPLLYCGLVCVGLCSWLELRGLRWVHASTATLIYTTIPMWGALFTFLLRNETVVESAALAGWVLLLAGLLAHWLARHPDSLQPSKRSVRVSADHLPGALLTSQLKFPYYAAQAQKLLTEAKVALKTTLLSYGVATNGPNLKPDLPFSPPHLAQLAPAPDHLAHAAASAPQLGDLAASLMVALISGLDSAAVAFGSDLVQALEEAEDVVALAGDAVNAALSVDVGAACHRFMELVETLVLNATTVDLLHPALSAICDAKDTAC